MADPSSKHQSKQRAHCISGTEIDHHPPKGKLAVIIKCIVVVVIVVVVFFFLWS
jgi:hypothetical protein